LSEEIENVLKLQMGLKKREYFFTEMAFLDSHFRDLTGKCRERRKVETFPEERR
jgi:hypothetical protein